MWNIERIEDSKALRRPTENNKCSRKIATKRQKH
jgi:hypothetical protein